MVIFVNDRMWRIVFVPSESPYLARSDGSYTIGCTDDKMQSVFISDAVSGTLLNKVICHELVHVYSFSYGLFIPIETEEMIADFLATYGRDVFMLADDIICQIIIPEKRMLS